MHKLKYTKNLKYMSKVKQKQMSCTQSDCSKVLENGVPFGQIASIV